MVLDGSSKDAVYRWVNVCELLNGQTISYYEKQLQQETLVPFDFSRYHLLISGLDRKVYRSYFGMDAFDYTSCFRQAEAEICETLRAQGVVFMSAMLLYDHSKRFALIFSTPGHLSPQEVAETVSGCFDRLYAQIFDMKKTPYSNYTVLSEEIGGYENLCGAFREIDALSRQQFFDMRAMVMTPSLLEQTRVPADPEQIHEELTQMYVDMRAGETAEMQRRFHAVMDKLEKARDFGLLGDVLSSMRRALEGMQRSHGVEPEASMRDVFSVEHYPTFQMQRDAIALYLTQCMTGLDDTQPMSRLIQEAVRYIRHHYAENIAVADIAEHIGMSESWLTKRFKQECGKGIVNFLLDVRVEKAKELLSGTDRLIQDIADAVGFENSSYFISVFRRVVGMTPKAYRNQMQGEEKA